MSTFTFNASQFGTRLSFYILMFTMVEFRQWTPFMPTLRDHVCGHPVPCWFNMALIDDGSGGEGGVAGKSNHDPKCLVLTKYLLLTQQAITLAVFTSCLAFLSTHLHFFSQLEIKFQSTWHMWNGTQHLPMNWSPIAIYSRYCPWRIEMVGTSAV